MFNIFQSAYTKFHSTEPALLVIHEHLIKSKMDRQQASGVTILDLSAALDTIDHSILLDRLTSWFGICDSALAWFQSYLSYIFCSASCLDNLSSSLPLSCGVPRALSWDPFSSSCTQLSSHISQTSACHEPQVDHHLYADDTQLFISFSPHVAHAAPGSLYATLAAISQWMPSNFLTLNPSKTEFLIIGLPTQLSKLHMPNVIMPDNSSITSV